MSAPVFHRDPIAAFLLGIHVALALGAIPRNFVAADEAAHIPSGISHWQRGIFHPFHVNPPLVRMLAVLPTLRQHPVVDYSGLEYKPGNRVELVMGSRFAIDNASRYLSLVGASRSVIVIMSALCGILVYRWAGALWGKSAATISLAVWAFCPFVLANAIVATPDLGAAFFGASAVYCFWRWLANPSLKRTVVAGVALGLAELSKFTLLILYPLLAAFWFVAWVIPTCLDRSALRRGATNCPRSPPGSIAFSAIVVLSVMTINLGYGFRGSCVPLGQFGFVSREFTGLELTSRYPVDGPRCANRFRGTWLESVPSPFPAHYLLGLDRQLIDSETPWNSYLRGEIRSRGWWYYYLYGLGIMLPIPNLILLSLSVWTSLRLKAATLWFDETLLWGAAIEILALVSSETHFNLHIRYVLPVMPFLAVAAGGAVRVACTYFYKCALLVGLVMWMAVIAGSSHPFYRGYFNELIGGSSEGHRHLLESNVDWGQELILLKEWTARHPDRKPFFMACSHAVDPVILGLDYQVPPILPTSPAMDCTPRLRLLKPGWYAISANLLHGVPGRLPDHTGREIPPETPLYALSYFRALTPVDRVGHSIMIYRIEPATSAATGTSGIDRTHIPK